MLPHPPARDHRRAVLAELHVVPPDALVVLAGEIDLHNVDQFQRALDAVVAAPVERLALDLSRVLFMSLGAMAALVDAAATLDRRGGRLILYGAIPLHRQLLTLLGAPAGLVVAEPAHG